MGIIFSKIYRRKDRKVLFLGLSNTYKTTTLLTLQRLYKKPPYTTLSTPTIGFNTEQIFTNNKNLIIWDLGGEKSIRSYWKCYYTNTKAIVYFFDAEREIETGCKELISIRDDVELKTCVFMIIWAGLKVDANDERIKVIRNILDGKQSKIFVYNLGNDLDAKNAFAWLLDQI